MQVEAVAFNRKAAASKWAVEDKPKEPDAATTGKEDEDELPNGPAYLASDTDTFWENFNLHVKEEDLESALHVFEAERGVFPEVGLCDVEVAFEFMRIFGEVPEWAQDFCPNHEMVKVKIKKPKDKDEKKAKKFRDDDEKETPEEGDVDGKNAKYEHVCKTCRLTVPAEG